MQPPRRHGHGERLVAPRKDLQNQNMEAASHWLYGNYGSFNSDVKLQTELDLIRRYFYVKKTRGIRFKNEVCRIVADDLQRQNSNNENLTYQVPNAQSGILVRL